MTGEGMPALQILLPGLETFLILLSVLSSGIANVKADIRCYCNLPICVATGYMCKSSLGTCFSEYFGYSTDLSKSRHGCMELYPRNQKELCQPHHRTKNSAKGRVAHVCCDEDMCNYVKNLDLNVRHYRINQTFTSSVFSPTEEKSFLYYPTAHEAALQQHIWFKAAVIAVPIAGSFILVILVFIALRMLRKDSKRQRQMQELRRQRQFKTYLLFARSRLLLEKKPSVSKLGDSENPSVYKSVSAAVSPSCASTGSKDKYFVYDL